MYVEDVLQKVKGLLRILIFLDSVLAFQIRIYLFHSFKEIAPLSFNLFISRFWFRYSSSRQATGHTPTVAGVNLIKLP